MHPRPNTIERIDPDETKLAEVHKHPFGIIMVYIQTAFAVVLVVSMAFFIAPSVLENNTDQAFLIAGAISGFAVIFAGIVLGISTYIYRQNRVVVTDRNITQILQFGLFSRKVSQLNIVNVEDVTSVQNGFIATTFNFGTLRIETAGEQSNFNFTFCPNSGNVAKIILDAREKMLGQMDDEAPIDVKHEVRNRPRKKSSILRSPKKSIPHLADNADKEPDVRNIGAEIVEHALDKKS